jgi:putative transposase
MLNPCELKAWCCRLNLNEPAQRLIDQVRSSEPARRVGGGRSKVSGIYSSRKMGVTIQFESHRVELAAIYAMEHDPFTLEFYDQPPSIMLDYNSAKGRRLSVRHTPDFFVVRQGSAGWEEWKTEEDLYRLTEHNPNRYCQEDGSWHCPPGERYATQFGLSYQVRCAKEINWRLQRNILFLHDYLHADPEAIDGATRERILACARIVPVISLADLIQQTAEFATPDDIYLLIAGGGLYVDLHAEPLVEPAKVRVFQDRDAALRHGVVPDQRPAEPPLSARLQSFMSAHR